MSLVCFEAAVRHSSYTRAAEELFLTQSAVCRQIAKLEEFLGVRLFRRVRRGIVPTAAGLAYSKKVANSLNLLERDAVEVMYKGEIGGELTIAVLPTFAHKWLVPKLTDFRRKHPGVTLNLVTRTRLSILDEPNIDAAIFAGDGHWAGCTCHLVFREELIPVCSPEILNGHDRSDVDFTALTLMHLDSRPYAWKNWLAANGVSVLHETAGPKYDVFSLLIEAAAHGLGAAMVPRFLVENDLHSGRLVELEAPADLSNKDPAAPPIDKATTNYFLVSSERNGDNLMLNLFSEWLLQMIGRAPTGAAAADLIIAPDNQVH